jgi:hypothetical protein
MTLSPRFLSGQMASANSVVALHHFCERQTKSLSWRFITPLGWQMTARTPLITQ